ncbi:MAG: 50S ribosomal protein L25 [Actinomycetota bacterium]|nr:50S ribosomal protein L25 [Actinomycetota bacterium]
MSEVVMQAVSGRELGSRASRRLRAEGFVPVTLYGGGKPEAAAVGAHELGTLVAHRRVVGSILEIELDGKRHTTLVKEIQRHPVKRSLLHVDLQLLSAKQSVTVAVRLVAGEGLELARDTIEVTGSVSAVPTSIDVDPAAMVDGAVTAGSLKLPKGIELASDPEVVVATEFVGQEGE